MGKGYKVAKFRIWLKRIKETLMEETKNTKDVYYEGLKHRRMDEYEIYKFGDYDVKRDYTKPKN